MSKKIVIIGAGFGGLEFVKALHNKPVEVLLIDKNNYHNFQPLMYQVATGGLEPGSIAYPIRRIFRKLKNVSFRMAEVFEVDMKTNKISTSIGNIDFDFLVIASGSQDNFFNFEPVKEKLLTLKSIPDALKMRNVIFKKLEEAMAESGDESRDGIMNIAIVGGGPAGIELAGALAEMKKNAIPQDYPGMDISDMNINLYEAEPKLLGAMSKESSDKSLEFLKGFGVNVHLNSRVKSYEGKTLVIDGANDFATHTVIWSAGVKGAPIKGMPDDAIVKGNRISVNEFNQVIGTTNIFAIGDVASHVTSEDPKGLPMLAPVAQQQGKHLAKNILRQIEQKTMEPFKYHNKGVMATIGKRKAVVDLPHYKFQGGFAWFVWMFIHIFSLVGFRSKVVTFMDWFANYFSGDRPLGLILKSASTEEKTTTEKL